MRYLMTALAVLGILGCSSRTEPSSAVAPPPTPGGPPVPSGGLVLSGPFVHENLALYLVEDPQAKSLGEFITLEEGLKSGDVRVSEKGQAEVAELLIENASDRPCFIQAGDVVKGGQQDRSIAADVVIPARSGKAPLPSFCVEQSRWHGGKAFLASPAAVASPELKMAIQKEKDQGKVWDKVTIYKRSISENNQLGASRTSSLNEEIEDQKVLDRRKAYRKALGGLCEGKPQAVGIISAINGRFSTADLYGDPGLLRKLFPRLLDSAALEAIAAPKKDVPWPTAADAAAFLAASEKGTASDEKSHQGLRVRTVENESTVLFESRYADTTLHRQSLKK
jgi:hypothetical protein